MQAARVSAVFVCVMWVVCKAHVLWLLDSRVLWRHCRCFRSAMD